MLKLSKIFLYNWHRFKEQVLEVEDSLFLAGHNGSGKSTVLDALQLVLVADLQKMKFNSSAQERSQRNLDSYVRGLIGEDRYLRKGNTVSYVALEFCDEKSKSFVTLGACVEAGPERHAERTWFVQKLPFQRDTFFDWDTPLTRRELRALFRKKDIGQTFDQLSEYQPAKLKALGGLGDGFYDLFMRALTFQPLRDVRAFVEQWLLEAAPLDVENLRHVSARLEDLHKHCVQTEAKIVELKNIETLQSEALRLRALHADYACLAAMAGRAHALQKHEVWKKNVEEKQAQVEEKKVTLAEFENKILSADQKCVELKVAIQSSDVGRHKQRLEADIQQLEQELQEAQKQFVRAQNAWSKHQAQVKELPSSAVQDSLLADDLSQLDANLLRAQDGENVRSEVRALRDRQVERLGGERVLLKKALAEVRSVEDELQKCRRTQGTYRNRSKLRSQIPV
jgi:DNA repair exonuclease SbcCD ATPase subunit